MSLLRPSNHSGQLSEMSLFCGDDLGAADGIGADIPLAPVMAALPVAVAARLLAIVGVDCAEEPAQAAFLVRWRTGPRRCRLWSGPACCS